MHLRLVICVALVWGCDDREAAQLKQVKDVVCTCKDAKCAEAAMKDLPQGDHNSSHRSKLIARDMLDCLAKLYEAERPSTDPDAPTIATDPAPPAAARTP